jgi:DNA polymerase III subunit delta
VTGGVGAALSHGRGMLTPMNQPPTGSPEPAPPAPLTLLTGSEPFLLSRAVARVVGAARACDPEVERRDVDAQAPGAEGDLLTALSPSLFGGSAVVVVSGLADAPEHVLGSLRAGVLDLAADTWVVALHSGERNKKALEELRAMPVPGGLVEITCAKVKPGRATRELLEQEARRQGRRITSDGVDALVMALGSDVALLVGALEQLLADSAEDPIDAAEVTATFAGVAEVSGFQLADAVWEGRALLALQRLRWGLVSQSLSGAGAVGSLASGLRAMVKVAGAPRGMSEVDVARLAGVPPFKVRVLRTAAASWEPAQLARAVQLLATVDAQIKGGLRPGESLEPAQKVRALEAFVIDTVGLQERPATRDRAGRTARLDDDLASSGGRPVS